MSNHRTRGAVAVVSTLALLVVVTAACGRRAQPAGSAGDGVVGGAGAASTVGPTATPTELAATAGPVASTDATQPPAGTEPPAGTGNPATTTPPAADPPPTAAPMAVPDLGAIDQLLADLDAALGADATADTDEGSAP